MPPKPNKGRKKAVASSGSRPQDEQPSNPQLQGAGEHNTTTAAAEANQQNDPQLQGVGEQTTPTTADSTQQEQSQPQGAEKAAPAAPKSTGPSAFGPSSGSGSIKFGAFSGFTMKPPQLGLLNKKASEIEFPAMSTGTGPSAFAQSAGTGTPALLGPATAPWKPASVVDAEMSDVTQESSSAPGQGSGSAATSSAPTTSGQAPPSSADQGTAQSTPTAEGAVPSSTPASGASPASSQAASSATAQQPPAPVKPAFGSFGFGFKKTAPTAAAAPAAPAASTGTSGAEAMAVDPPVQDPPPADPNAMEVTPTPATGDAWETVTSGPPRNPQEYAKAHNQTTTKFDLLEDDLGMQALIEKYEALKEPEEDGPKEDRKIVSVEKLPDNVKNKEQDKNRLYPSYLACDEQQKFFLDKVFEYRGMDYHPMFREKGDSPKSVGDKFTAMLRFPGSMSPQPNAQDYFLGAASAKLGGKAPADRALDPRFIEIQLRPDTQVPVFVIRVRRPTGTWVRCEIPAGALKRNSEDVGIDFLVAQEDVRQFVKESIPEDQQALHSFAKDAHLSIASLHLWDENSKPQQGAVSPPVWYNISQNEIQQHRDDFDKKKKQTPFECVIALLSRAGEFEVYTAHNDAVMKLLPQCCDYMRAICYATVQLDYYWWYFLAGKGTALDDDDYPFQSKKGNFLPFPRWMVDSFSVLYKDGEPVSCRPQHIADFDLGAQSNMPDAKSAMWACRLSMAREVQSQNEQLNLLCQRLRGRISCTINTFGDHEYCANLRFEGLAKGMTDVIMPELKRGCSIYITVGGIDVELAGAVCEDVFDSDANCSVHCTPVKPINAPSITDGSEFFAAVTFNNDHKATHRCLNAIMSIKNGHVNRQIGVCLPNITLSAPVPDGHQVSKKSFGQDKSQLVRMIYILWEQDLNQRQFQAGQQVLLPARESINRARTELSPDSDRDGFSMIWGPPGTGKTRGAMSIVKALAAEGTPVLVTASSNKAVIAAANAFDKLNRLEHIEHLPTRAKQKVMSSISDLACCRFTGAEFSVDWKDKNAEFFKDNLASLLEDKFKLDDNDNDNDSDDGDDVYMGNAPVGGGVPLLSSRTELDVVPTTNWADMVEEEREQALKDHKSRMLDYVLRTAYNKVFVEGEKNGSFVNKKLRYVQLHAEWDTTGLNEEMVNQAIAYKQAVRNLQALDDRAALAGRKPNAKKRSELAEAFRMLDQYWTKKYLEYCKVVFCTNNTACHDALAEYYHPKVILMDEAGFSHSPDAMVPLAAHKDDVEHFVQSGDFEQLKPVSGSSGRNEFHKTVKTSLFEKQYRSELDNRIKTQFNVQFRQAPDLSQFHREHVYKEFIDHPSVFEDNNTRACFRMMFGKLRPVYNDRLRVAIDVQEGFSGIFKNTASACNFAEAKMAINLAVHQIKAGIPPEHITLITPYSGQLRLMSKLARSSQVQEVHRVRIQSTNAMLGHENQSVILSLVQHQEGDDMALGFIYLRHLLVVETSRAQNGLVILGNFTGWISELVTMRPDSFLNRDDCKLFKNLLQDLYDKKDILDADDVTAAFAGKKVDSSRFYWRIKPLAPQLTNRGNLHNRGGRGGASRGANRGSGRGGSGFDATPGGLAGSQGTKRKVDPSVPHEQRPATQTGNIGDLIQPPRGRGGSRGDRGGRGDRARGRGRGRGS